MSFKDFKNLGIGVGLRPKFTPLFLSDDSNLRPSSVDFVEVISENFMDWESTPIHRPLQNLINVRKNYPVILHGVSLSIGSCEGVNKKYLNRLDSLIHKIEPAYVSDHLCFTSAKGIHSHDLLPLPYTEESLRVVCDNILRTQDHLKQKILIENPSSYLSFNHSTLEESEFLSEVVKKTNCGLLLDLNNIYVSSINHGFSSKHYIDQIPANAVFQYHLAGHSQREGYLLDTHDSEVCDDVWDLYQYVLEKIGKRPVMIERDSNIPEWSELQVEILKCRSMTFSKKTVSEKKLKLEIEGK